jgi:hypothetical protein
VDWDADAGLSAWVLKVRKRIPGLMSQSRGVMPSWEQRRKWVIVQIPYIIIVLLWV